jgi:hypothetical protein
VRELPTSIRRSKSPKNGFQSSDRRIIVDDKDHAVTLGVHFGLVGVKRAV